jgi:hypothetical protein
MRIRVLSDLHREFGTTDLPDITTELVVPAGDIDRGIKGVISTRQAFPKVPVLYVAGNHEHYDERIGRDCGRAASRPGLGGCDSFCCVASKGQ